MNPHVSNPADGLAGLHRECFACGVSNERGLCLHFEAEENGGAAATWMPSPAFRSYRDRVHGGVLATLADSAIVHCLFARGVVGVTAELTMRYLHGVEITAPVDIRAWLESERRGIYFCRAEIRQRGRLAARASAKFMAMPESG